MKLLRTLKLTAIYLGFQTPKGFPRFPVSPPGLALRLGTPAGRLHPFHLNPRQLSLINIFQEIHRYIIHH